MIHIFKQKWLRTLFIAVVTGLLAWLLFVFGVFNYAEYKVYDTLMVKTADSTVPSEDIMLVVLNQDSLDWAQEQFDWSWPWPRKAYADIVNFLADGGANSLVFDVMYTEPSIYGDQDDEAFATAAEKFTGVIHTVFLDNHGNIEEWPEDTEVPFFKLENFNEDRISLIYEMYPALFPIKILRQTTGGLGNNRSFSDEDDVIRRSNLFYPLDGKILPSLGLSSLLVREGKDESLVYNDETRMVNLLGRQIPVDENYMPLLRFRGNIDRYIPYSAREILESWYAIQNNEEPILEPHDFAGKYVFFGFYAPGLFDVCTTPISAKYPGVGVHITMLDNFLQNDFLQKSTLSIDLLLILVATLAGSFSILLTSHIPGLKKFPLPFTLLFVVLIAGVFITASAFMFIKGLWIPTIAPICALIVCYIITILIDYATEGKQKKYLKTAFRQYLSPVVIEELIANPDRLKLGGERKEISIYFSDVQGFTSISEKLSPEDLTALLNDYLSAMSDIILESGGTIDKYEGDAIIAFWNAPIQQDDHAKRALEAAMKCQQVLTELRPQLATRCGTDMYMRIGLNTGPAVVGNMGSHNRFDYTMLGDAVNLAARLEGQNKQFGTYLMCTQAMKDAAVKYGSQKHFRELAKIAVVGKKEAVTVFQPLETDEYMALKDWLPIFEEGLHLFYAGEAEKALHVFEKISKYDKPAFFYCEKCRKLIASGLENWQKGIWVADTK